MSDSSDEDGPRRGMAFTESTDFDGGQWGADGEFYAKGRKKARRQTQEEAIYGVFADDDSDGDDRGKKRGGREVDLQKPVAFVSGAKRSAAEPAEPGARRHDMADDDDDADSSSGDDESEGDGESPTGDGDEEEPRWSIGQAPKNRRRTRRDRRGTAADGPAEEDEGDAAPASDAAVANEPAVEPMSNARFRELLFGVKASAHDLAGGGGSGDASAANASAAPESAARGLGGGSSGEPRAAESRPPQPPQPRHPRGFLASAAKPPAPPQAPGKVPKGMGGFEKHTRGFASKYLERFGFKGQRAWR